MANWLTDLANRSRALLGPLAPSSPLPAPPQEEGIAEPLPQVKRRRGRPKKDRTAPEEEQ